MTEHDENSALDIDASTFKRPLEDLAEVLAQKVKREGAVLLPSPVPLPFTIHILVRQAKCTYNALFYINADERREKDPDWRDVYTIVTAPLVRSMIDCLYNITAILQDRRVKGPAFCKSGFKNTFRALDALERRYGGRPEWDDYIKDGREKTDFKMRGLNLTKAEVDAEKSWPTLGQYLSKKPGGKITPHQQFLETFTYGVWREYSALAHGAFEGLLDAGPYYTRDSQPHEDRPLIDASYSQVVFTHVARAAAILLCIVTELQAYFRFDGANINERTTKIWNTLMPVLGVKELYDERYSQLMKSKGMIS